MKQEFFHENSLADIPAQIEAPAMVTVGAVLIAAFGGQYSADALILLNIFYSAAVYIIWKNIGRLKR